MIGAKRRGNAQWRPAENSLNHVIDITNDTNASAEFQLAVEQLRKVSIRPELELTQIPAPSKMAHDAIAFSVSIKDESIGDLTNGGTGRFVLLHDLKPHEQWGSTFRIVTFAKSALEPSIVEFDDGSNSGWAWLLDALAASNAPFINEAGTATKIFSKGFGALSQEPNHAELEVRASWTPTESFDAHLTAWQNFVCLLAGFSIDPTDIPRIR